ncbi:MAG: zinc ribbon domain-containing protein [Gammaproteobacteria bacterium]|nr:zinc ribbon domain-containing protein [Gammaproteobacteria bacterium]
MPIYEYLCQACGREHEAMQKLNEPVLTVCPACGKPELKKRISAAGFQLKGNGWYATDFKGGSGKPKDGGDKAVDAGSGSDSAPAKKIHGCGGGTCGCA